MARTKKPVNVFLRMSAQLRDGLKAAAEDAGLSLNAYAVQVLASAAGDPARFRVPSAEEKQAVDDPHGLRSLDRDERGYPLSFGARYTHSACRQHYGLHTLELVADGHHWPLIKWIDENAPWHYVEWASFNGPLWPEGREPERRHDAA